MFPRNFKRSIYFLIWGLFSFIFGYYFSTIRGVEEILPCHQLDSQILDRHDADQFNRVPPHLKTRPLNSAVSSSIVSKTYILKYSEGSNSISNASNLLCSHFCVCNTLINHIHNSCIQLDSISSKNLGIRADSQMKNSLSSSVYDISLPVKIRFSPQLTGSLSDSSHDPSEFPFPSQWPFAGRGFNQFPQHLRAKLDFTLETRPFVVQSLVSDVLISPTPCSPQRPVYLFVIIPSAPTNSERRAAIRETWGRVARGASWGSMHILESVRLVFVIGRAPRETAADERSDAAIRQEAQLYDDVLQFNLRDSYTNLTLKVLLLSLFIFVHILRLEYYGFSYFFLLCCAGPERTPLAVHLVRRRAFRAEDRRRRVRRGAAPTRPAARTRRRPAARHSVRRHQLEERCTARRGPLDRRRAALPAAVRSLFSVHSLSPPLSSNNKFYFRFV